MMEKDVNFTPVALGRQLNLPQRTAILPTSLFMHVPLSTAPVERKR